MKEHLKADCSSVGFLAHRNPWAPYPAAQKEEGRKKRKKRGRKGEKGERKKEESLL